MKLRLLIILIFSICIKNVDTIQGVIDVIEPTR